MEIYGCQNSQTCPSRPRAQLPVLTLVNMPSIPGYISGSTTESVHDCKNN